MTQSADQILSVLDSCSKAFTFPMLDNGYVYLAATRMSLYRSSSGWAMVIEVFGFSPRSGIPDTAIYTFGSHITRIKAASNFVTPHAYEAYLANNPYNDLTFVFPIEEGGWQDQEDCELLAPGEHTITVRGVPHATPALATYKAHGIELQDLSKPRTFELCRFLASAQREEVLATPKERRQCVPPELAELLVLDEWHHPDLVNGDLPSSSFAFQTLANVLATGDVLLYQSRNPSNTHWVNWPDGGTL